MGISSAAFVLIVVVFVLAKLVGGKLGWRGRGDSTGDGTFNQFDGHDSGGDGGD